MIQDFKDWIDSLLYHLKIKWSRKLQYYNMLSEKLSNSQFNKSKSPIKNGTEVTLNLSWILIGSSYDETNFPHKLSLTDTHIPNMIKASANGFFGFS